MKYLHHLFVVLGVTLLAQAPICSLSYLNEHKLQDGGTVAAIAQESSSKEESLLTDTECRMIQYLQHPTKSLLGKVARKNPQQKDLQNLGVDLIWFAKSNQPPDEIKSKFDKWFNEPQISNMMKIWHGPNVMADYNTIKLDREFTQTGKRLGWTKGMPYHRMAVSPDGKHVLKICSVSEAIGRVYNRNTIERVVKAKKLAVKVPKKYLYINPSAAQEPKIILIADNMDLGTAKPWNSASSDLQKHLKILQEAGCPLDFAGHQNITYHIDNSGGHFVIIDTEQPGAIANTDFPKAPDEVVQYYLEWEKRQEVIMAQQK